MTSMNQMRTTKAVVIHVMLRAAALVCLVVATARPVLIAQQSSQGTQPSRSVEIGGARPLPLPPSDEPSPDTGRMRTPYVDFSRYTGPTMCLAASHNLEHLADRTGTRRRFYPGTLADTLLYDPARDTLATPTVQASRACAARFQVTQVAPHELPAFLALALRANDDVLAEQVVERWVMLAKSEGTAAQGEALRNVIEVYLSANPSRVAAAHAVIQQLDALDGDARLPRLRAHKVLHEYYSEWLGDSVASRREADIIRKITATLTPEDLFRGVALYHLDDAEEAWLGLQLAETTQDISAIIGNFKTAVDMAKIPPALHEVAQQWVDGTEQMLGYLAQIYFVPIGTPAPSLSGTYVFVRGDTMSRTGQRFPHAGRLSLLAVAPERWRNGEWPEHNFYAAIRRLHARYGDALDITLFTKTKGYTPGSLMQSPSEEAQSIRRYFHDRLDLPITLVVEESPVTKMPDGALVYGNVSYELVFNSTRRGMLIGKDGTIRRIINDLTPNPILDHIFDRIVQAETTPKTEP